MSDVDDEEAADEEDEDNEDEDCKSKCSTGKPPQQPAMGAGKKDQTQLKDDEVPRQASEQKTHRVNTARIAEISEEEERLSEYLIEAHAMELGGRL